MSSNENEGKVTADDLLGAWLPRDPAARSDREKIAAVVKLLTETRGSYYFGGGWDHGAVSVVAVAEALGIDPPNDPPPPPTWDERAALRAMLDGSR